MDQLTLIPLIPEWLIFSAASLAFALLIYSAFRGANGWWLRLCALAALCLMLLGPTLREEDSTPLNDIAFLVFDRSDSQTVSDRTEQLEEARIALEETFSETEMLDLITIDVTTDQSLEDPGSYAMSALTEAAAKVPSDRIAGAIIVSDGRVHDIESFAGFPAPVHLLLTGRNSDWDRRLNIQNAPAFAIIGEEINVNLRVEDQGATPGEVAGVATVSIAIDGGETTDYQVQTNIDLTLPLVLEHAGPNVLQISVIPTEGELTERNNEAVLSINGVRDRLRVLLVSGEPHPGERTWRNLLKSDSSVDLVHFTILRSPDKLDGVPVRELSLIAFPTRQLFLDKIEEFDLIIFDRYRRRGILTNQYLNSIVEYVREGGAVLIAPGPAFAGVESLARTPIGDILPAIPTARVYEQEYLPMVTELGTRHPVTRGLTEFGTGPDENGNPAWGPWLRQIQIDPLSGQTVMSGVNDEPLLILDRVGEGRIALMGSDHAWLWSRGYQGGGPQLDLLRRLGHWMMKEPELEEERLTAEVTPNGFTIFRQTMSEQAAPVELTRPDGRTKIVELSLGDDGRWSADLNETANGLYRLSDGQQSAVIALGPPAPREYIQTIASPEDLAPIMVATDGGFLRIEDVPKPELRFVREGRNSIGRDWFGLVRREAGIVTDIRQSDLLPAWTWLFVAAGFAVAAWLWEGRLRPQSRKP
ncbi:MAG: hypothetical protein AAF198_05705 [Pseudomonadota bacterium]